MEAINSISGAISVLDRADVDTDQIIPKQFLKRIQRTGFGEFLFYDWLKSGEITLEPNPILAAGRNFGCGSSREHAVWALQDFGFRCVIASSFADIFYANCTKVGILPVALEPDQVRKVMDADKIVVDLPSQIVTCGAEVFGFEIDQDIKSRLVAGLDDIAMTLRKSSEIDAYESSARARPGPVTISL